MVAAPAIGFVFDKAGLSDLRIPVQLWRAEDDTYLPSPVYAEAVLAALPQAAEYHVVPHAGHLVFLAPCWEALRRYVPYICVSEVGFDRAAFHATFDAEVVRFFAANLPPPGQ